MEKTGLKIAGIWNPIGNFEKGKTEVFPGAGFIRATAIERTSKNRYTVYVIADKFAYAYALESLAGALKLLQAEYDENGRLLSAGRGTLPRIGEKPFEQTVSNVS